MDRSMNLFIEFIPKVIINHMVKYALNAYACKLISLYLINQRDLID